MNKTHFFLKIQALLFIVFLFIACQSKQEKKILVEKDSLKKYIEEHDSLRIIKQNPNFKR